MFDWRGLTAAIAGDGGVGALGMIEIGHLNEYTKRNLTTVTPPRYGHRSVAGDHSLRWCTAAISQFYTTDDQMVQEDLPEMRKLTWLQMRRSTRTEVIRDECIDMISGKLLRDEIHRLALFQAPLDAGLL
jgi:hypothetical protein